MDCRPQNLRREIRRLEAELERLFKQPNVFIGQRGELIERIRLLKLR